MKTTVLKDFLKEGVSMAERIAAKNPSLPILSNILLKAGGGTIQLAATNLEIGITSRIRGKVVEEGVCTIPGKVFSDYVSLLDESTLTLEQSGTDLLIRNDRGDTKLHGLPAEDFPLIPTIHQENKHSCPASALREAISQVIFAAAYDDARPEISGVLLKLAEKELTLVATDSYRLAEKHVSLSEKTSHEVSAIVPVRALQELLRVLSQEGGDVSIFLTENQILFTVGDTELVSRLIDGQYPNYEQIVPVSHTTQATINTNDLVKAVRATSLFSRPGINDLTVTLEPKNKKIVLQAANNQVGENHREITADIDGDENTIVFNGRYLLDGLTNLRDENTVFQMTNNASPGVFRPAGSPGYLYIVMPIKQ